MFISSYTTIYFSEYDIRMSLYVFLLEKGTIKNTLYFIMMLYFEKNPMKLSFIKWFFNSWIWTRNSSIWTLNALILTINSLV